MKELFAVWRGKMSYFILNQLRCCRSRVNLNKRYGLCGQQQQQQQQQSQQQQQQQQQSVPLYQRQAAGSYGMQTNAIQSNNMQMSLTTLGSDINDHTTFENLFNHNGGGLGHSHTTNDLLGNAQHFQGLPPLQSFVNPVKSMSNSVHMSQK